ncbi:MAG: ABC transporter permease [Bacteroidetes bacterium]|nr:ABC transporter permease [Bacteroidota bacterium]
MQTDSGQRAQLDVWDLEIEPRNRRFTLNIREVWNYGYLLMMFVRRDIVSVYKQTVLGPLWFFIQPLLTTLTFTIVFGNIAKISTDGLPQTLFYMSGITIWNYFSETLSATSSTFTSNAGIFGKVYFPRLIMPLSKVISGLLKFAIQYLLFIAFLSYFILEGSQVQLDPLGVLIVTPIVLLMMAGMGLGMGLILSALTTKYRDLTFLISFGVQLLMYATPVIYPISTMDARFSWLIEANPLSWLVEAFRKVYLGAGQLSISGLMYSFTFMMVILWVGVLVFNKVEKNFMDTV